MAFPRTAITMTAALLCLGLASSARADIWATLDAGVLEIGMDEEDWNIVQIDQVGKELKVDTMAIDVGTYGTFTVVFEKTYVFPPEKVTSLIVKGSAGDELIYNYTSIPSWMTGEAGHDILVGGKGRDLLEGGPGADELYGGADDDDLFGGPGADGTHGGEGNDLLDLGGDTAERFQIGGPGRDGFVRYGYWRPRIGFVAQSVDYSGDQYSMQGLPEVTGTSDFSAAEGDYHINQTN